MRAFSQLLDDLVYTRSRNTKLQLIGDYLKETPDPDRGYGLAALTGTLDIPHVKPAAVRGLVAERIDPVLFMMSRDYVGDTAETVSLLWPKRNREPPEIDDATIRITDAIDRLRSAPARRSGGRVRSTCCARRPSSTHRASCRTCSIPSMHPAATPCSSSRWAS